MSKKKEQSNVVIYARFSPRKNPAESMSVETQLEYCRNWAKFHSLKVIGEYSDKNLSGARMDNRPGLQKALDYACKEKCMILVYSLSRLARSTAQTLQIGERLSKAGADLGAIKDKIDTTTSTGRFFFTILAALAQLEREQIAERTSDAMRSHQANGRRMSAIPPFGWVIDPNDPSRIIEDEYQQKIIKRVLELKKLGFSLRKSCDELLADGYKPPPKQIIKDGQLLTVERTWSHSLIRYILQRAEAEE